MSASVFPALPGIVYSTVERSSSFNTTVLRAWSGKEVRISRQTTPITSIRMVVNFARDNVNCTVSPWTGYSELAVIKYFHTSIGIGMMDFFHIADPDGGADISVRFASDELNLKRIVDHVWEGEISLVTVI